MLSDEDKEALLIRLRSIQGHMISNQTLANEELDTLIKEVEEYGVIAPF